MEKRIGLNKGIWEFCKYQNEIIKQYKEFIEKTIPVKILASDYPSPKPFIDDNGWMREMKIKEITIPETRFAILETPNIAYQWKMLNYEFPVIDPDVFVKIITAAEEEQNVNSN